MGQSTHMLYDAISTYVPNDTIEIWQVNLSACNGVYSVGPTGSWHTGQTVPCTQVLTRTGTGTASVIQVQGVSMQSQN